MRSPAFHSTILEVAQSGSAAGGRRMHMRPLDQYFAIPELSQNGTAVGDRRNHIRRPALYLTVLDLGRGDRSRWLENP